MTTQEMIVIAGHIASNLAPEETAEFAGILKDVIVNRHTTEELEIIDQQLLSAGIDVAPFCRKKHPS